MFTYAYLSTLALIAQEDFVPAVSWDFDKNSSEFRNSTMPSGHKAERYIDAWSNMNWPIQRFSNMKMMFGEEIIQPLTKLCLYPSCRIGGYRLVSPQFHTDLGPKHLVPEHLAPEHLVPEHFVPTYFVPEHFFPSILFPNICFQYGFQIFGSHLVPQHLIPEHLVS